MLNTIYLSPIKAQSSNYIIMINYYYMTNGYGEKESLISGNASQLMLHLWRKNVCLIYRSM